MKTHQWHSVKQHKLVDLTMLSRAELIVELEAERKDGLVTEQCMGNLLSKLEQIRDLADEELVLEEGEV